MTNTQAVETKYNTNYALRIIGNLGHDNKLFDRTCPQCKGAYSSYIINTCPKCGTPLTYITTDAGKPMAISEGTIYLSQGPKTEERDRKAIANRRNGLTPLYRFKTFAFADDNGVLGVPKDHQNMKSGAKVEVTIINHQAIPSGPFVTKRYGQTIELMLMVYEQEGDTVKILHTAEADRVSTPVQVNTAGAVMPTDTTAINAEIDAINMRIEALKRAAAVTSENPQVQTNVPNNVVVTDDTMQVVAEMDSPPFEDDGDPGAVSDESLDPFQAAS